MKVSLNAVLPFVLALIGSFGFITLWYKSKECRRLRKERDELLDTAFDLVCICNEREIMNLDLINDLIGLVESSDTVMSAETIAEMRELTDKQRLKCYRNLRKLAE